MNNWSFDMTAFLGRKTTGVPVSDGSSARRAWARLARPLTAALLIGAATTGMAADPIVDISVIPVPETVSLSRVSPPFVTYAAYEVTVINKSVNTLNNIRLEGTTSVLPTPTTQTAPLVASINVNCQTPGSTTIVCPIGQLQGKGAGTSSFVVIFQAPPAGTSVKFNWTVYYSEGSGDNPGSSHADFQSGFAETTLGTPTATQVKTYVPPGGGTFFTGVDGVARLGDPWTTTVTVPTAAKAEVVELPPATPQASDLFTEEASTLSIPGTFDNNLVILLRRDASTIAKGAKISSAKIYYEADAGKGDPRITYPYLVLPCTDTTWGTLPQPGIPCENKPARIEFNKKTAPTPDFVGDWQFEIWAKTNGKYTQ